LLIDRNQFIDEQPTPSQLYPISFVGPYEWGGITIVHSDLRAYGGAYSIGVTDGAKFSKWFQLIHCSNITGPTNFIPKMNLK
jgi:hypothetical protein